MIRLILFLVVAVALAFGATWLADNPGQISLVWQGYQIETSVAVLLTAIVIIGILLILLFEVLRLVVAAPKRMARRRQHAKVERGYMALSQGMVAAAAGDVASAKYLAKQADKLLDRSPSTLLLGAQTAQLEGDEGGARQKFRQMLKHSETEFLGLRGLLGEAMKDGDHDTALRLARRAYLRRPNTPWVLTTLFELQTRAGHWNEALSVIGDMARYKVVDKETATRRRAILFHLQAADERVANKPYEALYMAQKAQKLLPSFAPVAVQTAEIAEHVGKERVARRVLETSWRARPHPSIARAYFALSQDTSPAGRVKQAEKLREMAPPRDRDAELVFAEAALSAGRYQQAREALQGLLKNEPTVSVYRLLAELEQREKSDGEKARSWLAKAVDAPADPAWLCESTGEARATWSPFGPDGRFDSLHWGTPPKIVPLLAEDAPAQLILPGDARAADAAASEARPAGPEATGPVKVVSPAKAPATEAKPTGAREAKPAGATEAKPAATTAAEARPASKGDGKDEPAKSEPRSTGPARSEPAKKPEPVAGRA